MHCAVSPVAVLALSCWERSSACPLSCMPPRHPARNPNVCDDAHNCSQTRAEHWLEIVSRPAFWPSAEYRPRESGGSTTFAASAANVTAPSRGIYGQDGAGA
jgi:hypothetical protein